MLLINETLDWQPSTPGLCCSLAYDLTSDGNEYSALPHRGPLQSSTTQVHLHLLQPDGTNGSHYATLNAAEQSQAQRFMFSKDQVLYAAAHHFVRTTLSRYADLDPAAWLFDKNTYGKPHIANPGYAELQYNLSHTHGMVAIAVIRQRAIGVDTEQARPLDDIASLSRSVFATPERADVLACTGTAQQQRFFTYWTLKEAYIKARGMGLSIPLQQFHFIAGTPPLWHLTCDPSLNDNGAAWYCRAFRVTEHYHVACVVDRQLQ